MVGQTLGVFTALEVKTANGKLTEKQGFFLKAVNDNGGLSGVVRSVDDALELITAK